VVHAQTKTAHIGAMMVALPDLTRMIIAGDDAVGFSVIVPYLPAAAPRARRSSR
jgi:hypothetical protein